MARKKFLILSLLGTCLVFSSSANAFFCFNFFGHSGGGNKSRVNARIQTITSPNSRINVRTRGFQRPIVETRYLPRNYPPIMQPPLVRNRIYLTN